MAWPYGASRSQSVGLLWTSDHPVADNTQHSQETDIPDPSGVRTHNSSKRAAVGILKLRSLMCVFRSVGGTSLYRETGWCSCRSVIVSGWATRGKTCSPLQRVHSSSGAHQGCCLMGAVSKATGAWSWPLISFTSAYFFTPCTRKAPPLNLQNFVSNYTLRCLKNMTVHRDFFRLRQTLQEKEIQTYCRTIFK